MSGTSSESARATRAGRWCGTGGTARTTRRPRRARRRAGAGARVRRGLRIGDHEEGEEQERAALEAVERNRQRLAEPDERPANRGRRRSRETPASHRCARRGSRPARRAPAIRNANNAASPHWAGDTQPASLSSSITTRPMFVGLKTCLPFHRTRNLLPIATAAAAIASSGSLVRSKRQSDRAEISALRGSKAASRRPLVQAYCVASMCRPAGPRGQA